MQNKHFAEFLLGDLKRAKSLHKQFLPKNYHLCDELTLASYYQPAEQIGGDYFNFFKFNNDKMIIYLSDVSGHGIDGAMLNIYLKNSIDFLLMMLKDNGKELISNELVKQIVKKFLLDDFSGEYMICLFFGVLDLNSYKFTYASAGFQTPMIVFTEDGTVVRRELGGLPISTAIPSELYDVRNQELDLQKGASILLFTDGMIEEESSGKYFSVERIEKIVKTSREKPPKVIKEEIIEAFKNFIGDQKNTDDITFIILKRGLAP